VSTNHLLGDTNAATENPHRRTALPNQQESMHGPHRPNIAQSNPGIEVGLHSTASKRDETPTFACEKHIDEKTRHPQ
jgi:hypothetical protein